MGNVGEKLEEARKRQAISLREASEATKIRSEYLSNFENDNFDFDLPDVYKRGFVKMYARHLKIEIEPFMADVDALMLGRGKGKGGSREFFGRMDLPGAGGNPQGNNPFSSFSEGESGVGVPTRKGETPSSVPPAETLLQATDKTLYWKIGLIFVGTFIVVGLLALLIQTIFSSPKEDPALAGGSQPAAQVAQQGFVIVPSGNTRVIVQELSPERRIVFDQEVQAGQRYPVQRNGNVRVVSNNIENVGVEVNGQLHRAPTTGRAQWLFDADGPTSGNR